MTRSHFYLFALCLASLTLHAAAVGGPLGSACTQSAPDECQSVCCFQGTCSTWDKCFPAPQPGPPGAPCEAGSGCGSGCCHEGTCHDAVICFGRDPATTFARDASEAVLEPQPDQAIAAEYPLQLTLKDAEPFMHAFAAQENGPDSVSRVPASEGQGPVSWLPDGPAVAAALVAAHGEGQGSLLLELAGHRANGTGSTFAARFADRSQADEPFGGLAALPGLAPAVNTTLVSPTLYLKNCPDNQVFACCAGECNREGCTVKRQMSYVHCPTNAIGYVTGGSCWDNRGGCVACRDGELTDACNAKYPECNGACRNSWVSMAPPYRMCCPNFPSTCDSDCPRLHNLDSRCARCKG